MPRANSVDEQRASPSPSGLTASRALSRHAIPGDAWRAIINCCGRDTSFCHLVIPKFLGNGFVLLLLADNGQKYVDKANETARRHAELQAVASNPESANALEEESR